MPGEVGRPVKAARKGCATAPSEPPSCPTNAEVADKVQRFVALGLPADAAQPPYTPVPRLQADPANFARLREQFGLAADRPAVAFMPGAEYGPAKQWPLRHYGELARLLVARGHQVWVLGSGKDQAAGDEIAALAGPGVHNLCGRTQLADAVDLLDAAVAAVSPSSWIIGDIWPMNPDPAAPIATSEQAINQKENLVLAQKIYDKATLKYKEGVGSTLEIMQAETELRTANNNYMNAIYDLVISKIDYRTTTGTPLK